MAKNTSYLVNEEGADINILAPGVKMEDIEITTQCNTLTVKIPDNPFTGKVNYVQDFSPLLDLQESKASLKEGILKLTIPYAESKKPKRIAITGE